MALLGKIEKIDDLRTIWKHEAHDFSKWLASEEGKQGIVNGIFNAFENYYKK